MSFVSIILAIIVIGVLILVHEFGHFLLAKKNGIGVTEFSVGMGPRIVSFVRGETRYSLKWIPFGGSCMMMGEDEDLPDEKSFNNKSVWARISVIFAGPFFNFLLAFVLALIVLGNGGVNPAYVYGVEEGGAAAQAGLKTGDVITKINNRNITIGRDIELYLVEHPLDGSMVTVEFERDGEKQSITFDPNRKAVLMGFRYYATEDPVVLPEVTKGQPFEEAGIRAGDTITAIDGTPISSGLQLQEYMQEHELKEEPVTITYERNGKSYDTDVTPKFTTYQELGFSASYGRVKSGPIEVIKNSFYEVGYWIRYSFTSLKMLVTGRVSSEEISGPVGIVSMVDDMVEQSKPDGLFYVFLNLANFAILLSANLGVLNLLPLPALDGGRLLFLLIEAVRGKPIDREKEGYVHMVGMVLLMILMVLVLFNDIVKLF